MASIFDFLFGNSQGSNPMPGATPPIVPQPQSATPPSMLLDPAAMDRQRNQDLLMGLASGFLKAGAPSRVPIDLGTAFGDALQGAQGAMATSDDRYLKRAMTQAQVATANQKLQQYKDWKDLFSGAAGGSAPTATATPQQTAAPSPQAAAGPNDFNIGNVRPVGSNTGFQQPASLKDGIALAQNTVKAYPTAFNNGQPMTLTQIGAHWAPSNENDTAAWVRNVASISGLDPNKPLDLNDPATMAAVTRGIHGAEKGQGALLPPEAYMPGATAVAAGNTVAAPPQFAGAAAPPNAEGQGDSAPTPPPAVTPPAGKTLAQVVQTIPPGVRQMIGAMGPQQGMPLLLKYADPETVPAIDSQTGAVVFAPKTELNSGRYTPIDAQKLANETSQLNIARERNAREGMNAKVVAGPNGQPTVNQPLLDYDTGVSAARGTNPEGRMRIGDYDDARKANSDLQGTAMQARTGIAQTNHLGQLLEQVNTGRFTESTQNIKQMAKGLGINLDALGVRDDVGPAQAADALVKQLALTLRNPSQGAGMPGSLSNSDRDFLAKMVPGLETTPEGRKLMIDYAQKMYQRQIDLSKVANDFMRSPEAKQDPLKLYTKLQQYADAHPLFSEKDLPQGGFTPNPNVPPPPAGFKLPGQSSPPPSNRPAPPAGFRVIQ